MIEKKSTAEKIKVMQAYLNGEALEATTDGLSSWVDLGYYREPTWDWEKCDYRVKEEGHTLDIPWELIEDRWKWAVMDDKGVVWLTEEKPGEPPYTRVWVIGGSISKLPLKIRTPSVKYWDKTLTKRPEGV